MVLRKFVIIGHDFFGSDSKLMKLQNFSQLIVDSWYILVLISFCILFMVDLMSGFCLLLYSLLSLRFSLMRSRMATNRRFGVVAAVHFRCGCVDCLHEFVTKGDCKFLQFVLSGYVGVNIGWAVFQCVV